MFFSSKSAKKINKIRFKRNDPIVAKENKNSKIIATELPKPLNSAVLAKSAAIGLTSEEAETIRHRDGENTLAVGRRISPIRIFFSQFKDVMILILLSATVISVFLGEITDAVTIILIVLINAILGFIQEFRTERTLEVLGKMAAPTARCYRDSELQIIPAQELVVGDVIELEAGDRVPADAVLVGLKSLYADESILTGEAITVEKSLNSGGLVHKFDEEKSGNGLGKPWIVYAGTVITKGHGRGRVVATGIRSQMGRISGLLSDIQPEPTPLQRRLGELGKGVAIICLAVCAVVFGAGVLRGEPVFEMLLTGISIAIAAIPEGLPATVTIALALAVSRMLGQKALVNKLHSVETLGCTSVICTDKTGTLTENRMTVQEIFSEGIDYHISGNGYRVAGEITDENGHVNPKSKPGFSDLLTCCVMCNTASIEPSNGCISGSATNSCVVQNSARSHRNKDSDIVGPNMRARGQLNGSGEWKVLGDPTEIALLVAAAKGGITRDCLSHTYTLEEELPFESETRCMMVSCRRQNGSLTAFCKGAVDVVLSKCQFIMERGVAKPLTISEKRRIQLKADKMGTQALRVLAFAEKDLDKKVNLQTGSAGGMIFLGIVGMMDPPRSEARRAVAICEKAHIKTVMITGDQPVTAAAVARQVGILSPQNVNIIHKYIDNDTNIFNEIADKKKYMETKVITGSELELLSDKEFKGVIQGIRVYARVSPKDKLRIVKIYKECGLIVTMTGDGVNDAPAIKEAHIGVSMGLSGTDVAKNAADVVLLDDNFATLVSAVRQGRTIYANIRRFVRYLLSCNIGEVITMFLGLILGMPLVLLPTQILLVNLVTDGLPAIALGVEPPEESLMQKPPRPPEEGFFSGGLLSMILFRGVMIGLCTLGSFVALLRTGAPLEVARTGALFTLVASQLIHVFECKSETKNIFTVPYLNNFKLILAVLVSAAVLILGIYLPSLQMIFSTVALTGEQLGIAGIFSIGVPVLYAIFGRRRSQRR